MEPDVLLFDEPTSALDPEMVGEVLDVDGDCGGYNLGFAWMSGMIVGKHIRGDKS